MFQNYYENTAKSDAKANMSKLEKPFQITRFQIILGIFRLVRGQNFPKN